MPCGDGTGPLGLGPGIWGPRFPGYLRWGRGWFFPRPIIWDGPATEEAFLKRRARLLEEELAEIKARLEQLSGKEEQPE